MSLETKILQESNVLEASSVDVVVVVDDALEPGYDDGLNVNQSYYLSFDPRMMMMMAEQ